jgi:hypothetical protein
VRGWVEAHAPSLDIVVPVLGALLVVMAGKLLAARQARVPEAQAEPRAHHAEIQPGPAG